MTKQATYDWQDPLFLEPGFTGFLVSQIQLSSILHALGGWPNLSDTYPAVGGD
jgi:hypothetical protein